MRRTSTGLLVALTLLPAAEGREAVPYRWLPITQHAPFAARDGAGALTLGGTMYLLGGWNPPDKVNFPLGCNSEVWASSDGLDWREIQPQAPWEGRHTAGWVVHADKLWVIGGDCNQKHYQNDVWNSADGVHWTQVADDVPWAPRALHFAWSFRGKLWVAGGQTMPAFAGGEERFYHDVWCSDDGVSWTRVVEQAPWPPRGMSSGQVILHDKIWILGGGTYDTPSTPTRTFYNDVWSSPDGITWTRVLEQAPWTPRQYHEIAVWDDRMWVMEGWNRTNRNDVWYSADGATWTELPDTPWAPRHAASLFVHDDALWMVAGNNLTPDVWKLVRNEEAGDG